MAKLQPITIMIAPPTALDTVVGQTVAADDTRRPAAGGTFFVLLDVNEIGAIVTWAQPFAAFLSETYWRAFGDDPGMTAERALGLTRQRARAKLQQLCRETRTLTPSDAHYVIGALVGRQLFLSNTGTVRAYLLHRFKPASASAVRYRWVDITATAPTATGRTADADAAIISGTIGDGDTVVVCTESVTDNVSLEKLQRIVTETPTAGIATLLDRYLAASVGRQSFGLTLLRPAPAVAETATPGVVASMEGLREREDGTSALLAPPNLWSMKRWWPWRGKSRMRRTAPNKPASAEAAARTARPPVDRRRWGWHAGQLTRRLAETLAAFALAVVLVPIRLVVTAWPNLRPGKFAPAVRTWTAAAIDRILHYLRSLPRSSQRIVIVALLTSYLFVQSLVFLAQRQTREADVTATNQRIAAIQEALDQAESDIIFGNDDQAAGLVRTARATLATLPQTTREQRARWQLLEAAALDAEHRLEHLATVNTPTLVGRITGPVFSSPDGLLSAGGRLLLYRRSDNTFALLDPATGTTQPLGASSTNIGRLTLATLDDGQRPVFLTSSMGLATLDLGTRTLAGTSLTPAPKSAAGLAIYNSRLYLLDPGSRQIWRYQKTAAGYAGQRPWVKGNTQLLADATSLTVDGSVYVLGRDGSITKYTSGEVQPWRGRSPLNAPPQAQGLQSPLGSKNLYAMDSATRRLLVWDKPSGRLVQQYEFPSSFSTLKAFTVDEKQQVFYVLNDSDVYKVGMAKQ